MGEAVPVPNYQTLMRPVLELHADGMEHAVKAAVAAMADKFELTGDERKQLLASGRSTPIANRVNWAVTYLVHAAVPQRPRRAHTMITKRGNDLLATAAPIDVKVLEQFAEFRAFTARTRAQVVADTSQDIPERDESPPREAIPALVAETHAVLAIEELVERLREASPEFFERCVLQLLVKMGYGGIAGDAEHLGKPGDGGFDRLVRKDPLGFDVVYTQAKRYKVGQTVGAPEVQAFVGHCMAGMPTGVCSSPRARSRRRLSITRGRCPLASSSSTASGSVS
jgi:restriction system protein